MKKYKFITIKSVSDFNKRPLYQIYNNKSNDILGQIFYYSPWRQYCFRAKDDNCIWNNSCMLDIIDFLENHAGKD